MPDMVEALQTFYEGQCAGLQAEVARLTADLAASRAEAIALRAALEFYADPTIWGARWIDNRPFLSYAELDGGLKARAALAAWRAGRE